MKLMTKVLQERFENVGDQSESKDPLFIAKFFNPVGSQTWYASEYNPETKICYGYVTGMYADEWGTFSLNELEDLKLPFGLGIERDIHFKEVRSSTIIEKDRMTELKNLQSQSDIDQDREQG